MEKIPFKHEFPQILTWIPTKGLFEGIHHLDIIVLYFLNVQIHNPPFDFLMPIITFAGTQIFWILTSIFFYFFGDDKGKETALTCILALLLGYFVSESLKSIFQVPRPFEVIPWVRHLSDMGGYSLPSGHATAAFSGFLIIGVNHGRLPIFMTLAILVGISRIYMGVHYPSDVVLGAFIGISCALVSFRIKEKLLNP